MQAKIPKHLPEKICLFSPGLATEPSEKYPLSTVAILNKTGELAVSEKVVDYIWLMERYADQGQNEPVRDYFYIEDQFEYNPNLSEEENDDEESEGGMKNLNVPGEIVKPPASQRILIKQIVDTQP